MDAERWEIIQKLFEQAVDLEPSAREQFLSQECGSDSGLLKEVRSLINADDGQHSLLDNRASDLIEMKPSADRIGRLVGPYRVVSRIASGGMGSVFLAERADGQFSRQVALKLIKRGMDTDEILRRFRGERQILAELNHPNISRLIDGGLTDDGLPWFSMEYVDGVPIDKFCDGQRLTIGGRLKLFLSVCRTVEYAQQNLVVHRDLKPSNILVTKEGAVKLLDFGIAKLLGTGPGHGELNDLTRTGFHVMTPEYASPEQVRADKISTASDVYSLGVILYLLLTGGTPYRLDSRTPSEIEKVICDTDPLRPSAAVSRQVDKAEPADSTTPQLSAACSARSTQPARLRRMLSGDLDNICLMALRKEPEQRYHTAGQLADDIERYLDGRPVKARKISLGYRCGKFMARNRWAVTAGLAIVVIISTLVGFYTVRLARERDRAKSEAAKAEQVSEFLTSLFMIADPNESKGETVTAREVLDRGAERIDSELEDQPTTQAAMLGVMGTVYIQLGLFEKADTLLTKALSLREQFTGFDDPDLSASTRDLAMVAYSLGDYARAEKLYRRALEIDRSLLGEGNAAVAEDLCDLAATLRLEGERDEALALQEKALDLRIKVFGEMHPDVAHSMNHLGGLLHEKGDDERAEKLLRRGLEIRRQVFDSSNFEVVASMGKLAQFLVDKNRYPEAERLYLDALTILKRLVGEDHHYVGGMTGNLARLYLRMGRTDLADSLMRTSLRILRAALPEGHVNTAGPLVGLADVRIAEGRPEEAMDYLKEALAIRENALPPHHELIAQVRAKMGLCLMAMSEYDRAEGMMTASLPILLENHGPQDRLTRQIGDSLIDLSYRLGASERADSLRKIFDVTL